MLLNNNNLDGIYRNIINDTQSFLSGLPCPPSPGLASSFRCCQTPKGFSAGFGWRQRTKSAPRRGPRTRPGGAGEAEEARTRPRSRSPRGSPYAWALHALAAAPARPRTTRTGTHCSRSCCSCSQKAGLLPTGRPTAPPLFVAPSPRHRLPSTDRHSVAHPKAQTFSPLRPSLPCALGTLAPACLKEVRHTHARARTPGAARP